MLLIEAIDKFREKDNITESRLKFWFPKYFPKKFRVIVTASKSSQAYAYLKKQGCQIMKLETTQDTLHSLLRSYRKRNFVMDEEYKKKIFEIVQKKITEETCEDTLLIKTIIGCLCPYQTPLIVNLTPEGAERIHYVLASFDLNR